MNKKMERKEGKKHIYKIEFQLYFLQIIISFKGNVWETPSYSYTRKQFFPITS